MEYIASISHGKDSIAMLHVIKDILHLPLDRIVTVDVWFDENTRAELPPMVEWKDKADKIIFDKWGIIVEHKRERESYKDIFYRKITKTRSQYRNDSEIYGFPIQRGAWCNSKLKVGVMHREIPKDSIQYIGIASDEEERIERHKNKNGISMPLVEAGWTEKMCYEWCEQNGMLAPTYTTSMRDGCWFCHNQGVQQLRNLRKNYPELWKKLMDIDNDSTITFHADGHTVHDFDKRFEFEDAGYETKCKRFRWSDLEEPQMNIYQFL